ncbi:thermonuclease family protein [Roseibium sp. M-1]
MKLRPFLMPLVVLTAAGGLLGWLLLAEPPQLPEQEPEDQASTNSETTIAAAPVAPVTAAKQEAPPGPGPASPMGTAPLPDEIRDVSPDGVSAPKVSGNLKRIEPSKRYLELKDPPVEPVPDGPLELVRVQVLDGGHLKSDRLTITLAHIVPLKPEETCVSRLGGSWPCGARARTFLRGLIRQLKVTCEKIEETGPQQILATCSRGNFDLSTRLVRYGWADPAPDAPDDLLALAEKAKEKKLGKWQSEWLNELPVSSWENEPTTLPGLEDLEPEIVEWSLRTDPEQPESTPLSEETATSPPDAQ